MTPDDVENDHVLALVANLTPRDVDRGRAERLRARCQASLHAHERRNAQEAAPHRASWRRVFASSVAGAWCLVYLLEIIRRAALIYGQ